MIDLHPQLAQDTVEVKTLGLSQVLLMNDARFPWLILVPGKLGLREIKDLEKPDRAVLMEEITTVSGVLDRLYMPDKINVGALGNLVQQLHIHVIARFKTDPAWPGPVWGHGEAVPYSPENLAGTRARLADLL